MATRTTDWKMHMIVAIGLVIVCFAPGAVGSAFTTTGEASWYQQLERPAATPPGWVFPVVWNILYLLMALAAYLLWRRVGFGGARLAWGLFAAQLVLNGAWSLVFFAGQSIVGALIVIALLDLAVLATIVAFWPHTRLGALLLLPYIAWLALATYLNLRIWQLN